MVHADPDAIDAFAQQLQRFCDESDQNMRRLNAQFARVSELWKDEEYRKYADNYQKSIRALSKFITESRAQVRPLRTKAEHLRRYLGR